jgi:hypothetical protein
MTEAIEMYRLAAEFGRSGGTGAFPAEQCIVLSEGQNHYQGNSRFSVTIVPRFPPRQLG